MDPDLFLVLGIVIGALAVPSILSAVSDNRAPRASALTILIAFGLVFFAFSQKPGGYTMDDIPRAFVEVVSRFIG